MKKGVEATCKLCNKKIKCVGGSTSGMRSHLKSQHKLEADDDTTLHPVQNKLNFQPVSSESLYKETIARLAAVDGFSFHQISTSQFIQEHLRKTFSKSPAHHSTVQSIVKSYYSEKVDELKTTLKSLSEKKFSIVFDEWTSNRNRRFLSLTLSSNKQMFNIGLVRVTGSCTASRLEGLITSKLEEFDLVINKDIV